MKALTVGSFKLGIQGRRHMMAAVVSIGIVAPITWMVFDRDPPYTVISGVVNPAHAAPGQTVEVTWDIKIGKNCFPAQAHNITRTFTDVGGEVHVFSPVPTNWAGGGTLPQAGSTIQAPITDRNIERLTVVPVMPPGPAKYQSKACYICNPVQEIWPVCITTPQLTLVIDPPENPVATRR